MLCVRNAMDEQPHCSRWHSRGRGHPANSSPPSRAIPSLTERQSKLFALFSDTLERVSPDFQPAKAIRFQPGQGQHVDVDHATGRTIWRGVDDA